MSVSGWPQWEQALAAVASIRNSKTGKRTPFELWFIRSSCDAVPWRFEYQPRGVLKLAFLQTEAGIPAGLRKPVTEVKT